MRIKAPHLPERVALLLLEPDLIAVGEEDEDVSPGLLFDVVGILLRLLLSDKGIF